MATFRIAGGADDAGELDSVWVFFFAPIAGGDAGDLDFAAVGLVAPCFVATGLVVPGFVATGFASAVFTGGFAAGDPVFDLGLPVGFDFAVGGA